MTDELNMSPEEIKNQLDQDDLTIQVEQFLTTFIENIAEVAFKAIKNQELKPDIAYHDYRQLLLYVESFHQMIYHKELADSIIEYFDVQMPKGVQEQDEHILHNYSVFWANFLNDFADTCNLKQRHLIKKILKQTQYALERDYGYEPKIQR